MRSQLLGVVVLVLLAPSVAHGAKPLRVSPEVTVRNAVIEIRGSGFKGKRSLARIGGRKATVRSGTRRRLHVVVPLKLRPGRHAVRVGRLRGSLRLVKPYSGKLTVTREARATKAATIGPGGGKVATRAADGTVLTLTVPAGALTSATPITISPVRVRGLPLTGGFSTAAHFAPEGLKFARPARLTIALKRKPRGRLVGFNASGSGRNLGFVRARIAGRVITKDVAHFSVDGAATAAPSDIAIFLQGLVESDFPLPVGQIDLLRDQIGIWSDMFGASICEVLCAAAVGIATNSLVFHIDDACEEGLAAPSLVAYQRVTDLEARRQEWDLVDPVGEACRHQILRTVINRAITGALLDQLAEADTGQLPNGAESSIQLDNRERITRFEWLMYLWGQTQLVGSVSMSDQVGQAVELGWRRLISNHKPLCDTDQRDLASANLDIGFDYAIRMVEYVEEFHAALDYCRLEVDMAPLAPFAPGESRQLQARFTGLVHPDAHNEVTWSAAGGTITPGGVYTAPTEPGSYSVSVKSALNPNRAWTASVSVGCGAPAMRVLFSVVPETCEAPALSTVTVIGAGGSVAVTAGLGRNQEGNTESDSDSGSGLPLELSASTSASLSQGAPATASASGTLSASATSNNGVYLLEVHPAGQGQVNVTDATGVGEVSAGFALQFSIDSPLEFGVSGTAVDPGRGEVVVRLREVSGSPAYVDFDSDSNDYGTTQLSQTGTLPAGSYQFEVLATVLANQNRPQESTDSDVFLRVGGG